MTKKYTLPEYTLRILEMMKWTQAELAHHAGLSRTAINDVIAKREKGGYKYAIAIAEAAGRPPEEALQAAGIMDIPIGSNDEVSREILHNVKQMDRDNQQDMLEYSRMKIKMQKQKGRKKDDNDHRGTRPPTS